MSIQHAPIVTCDIPNCTDMFFGTPKETDDQARETAKAAGWSQVEIWNKELWDLCPHHTKAAEQGRKQNSF